MIQGTIVNYPMQDYQKPINTKKNNIGMEEQSGDYWHEEIVNQLVDMLKEYEYIFPSTFFDMKRIAGELGEMKIKLWPDTKSVKKRPY